MSQNHPHHLRRRFPHPSVGVSSIFHADVASSVSEAAWWQETSRFPATSIWSIQFWAFFRVCNKPCAPSSSVSSPYVSKGRFTQSSTSGPSQLPSHSQSGVSFSFAASTRWAESQRTVLHGMHVVARVSPDLADRKADASLYSRVCEPDPLNLGLVAFYVRSFVEQTTVLAEGRAHRRGSRRESAGV